MCGIKTLECHEGETRDETGRSPVQLRLAVHKRIYQVYCFTPNASTSDYGFVSTVGFMLFVQSELCKKQCCDAEESLS